MAVRKSMCTFCLRQSAEEADDWNGTRNFAVLKQFIKGVERYFGKEISKECGSELVEACQDCVILIKSFCDLYHDWKVLEMKMEWELRRLMNVMNSADKVRSRKQAFTDMLLNEEVNTDDGKRVYKLITRFRKDFNQECKK